MRSIPEQDTIVRVQLDPFTTCVGSWQRRGRGRVCVRIWCFNQPVNVWVDEAAVVPCERELGEDT